MRIQGHAMYLEPDEARLFGTGVYEMIGQIPALTVLDDLVRRRRDVSAMQANPELAPMIPGAATELNARARLFLPVAGAILSYEVEQYLVAHPKADPTEL